jgi:hypothetical protein
MYAEIGTEAAQFPEKEYIIGIFVAVWCFKNPTKDICTGPLWNTREGEEDVLWGRPEAAARTGRGRLHPCCLEVKKTVKERQDCLPPRHAVVLPLRRPPLHRAATPSRSAEHIY